MTDTDRNALTRARRAMDAAILRAAIVDRTSLAALTRTRQGVPYDPACGPRPATVRWSRHALKSIGREPKPLRLDEGEYAWQSEAGD